MIEPKVCCTKLAFKLMCHLCLDLDFVPAALAERIHRQVETCLGPKLGDGEASPTLLHVPLCMSGCRALLQTVAVKQGSEPDYTAMQCPVPLLPTACCGACTACIRCAASLLCYLALLAVSLSFCLAE